MKKKWIYLFIIAMVSLAIYAHAINFSFIFFDDDSILLNNPFFFIDDFSLKQIFTTDAFIFKESTFYCPLQNLTFAFDAFMAGGIYSLSFHLTNLILFLGIGISLYFFCYHNVILHPETLTLITNTQFNFLQKRFQLIIKLKEYTTIALWQKHIFATLNAQYKIATQGSFNARRCRYNCPARKGKIYKLTFINNFILL